MKKIWIATIETEDCETYTFVFASKPTQTYVKKLFFVEYGDTYDPSEVDIYPNISDHKVLTIEK